MKRQGKNSIIKLLGMNRNRSGNVSVDGEMEDIINLRLKNGSLEVVGNFPVPNIAKTANGENLAFAPSFKNIYLHRTSEYAHWIFYSQGDANHYTIYYYPGVTQGDFFALKQITVAEGDSIAVTSIYNYLILTYGDTTEYFLWDEKQAGTNKYVEQHNDTFDFSCKIKMDVTDDDHYFNRHSFSAVSTGSDSLDAQKMLEGIKESSLPTLLENLNDISSDGELFGTCLWMYALRAKTGEYIYTSNVMQLTNLFEYTFDTVSTQDLEAKAAFSLIVMYPNYDTEKVMLTFNMDTAKLSVKLKIDEDLQGFKDKIMSVDVFMSPVVLPYVTDAEELQHIFDRIKHSDYHELANVADILKALVKTPKAIQEELKLKSSLFLAKSISAEEIATSEMVIPLSMSLGGKLSFETLATERQAPAIETHYDSSAQGFYNYNGKIHKYGITDFVKLMNFRPYQLQGGMDYVLPIQYNASYANEWERIYNWLVPVTLGITQDSNITTKIVAKIGTNTAVYTQSGITFDNCDKYITVVRAYHDGAWGNWILKPTPYVSYTDVGCISIDLYVDFGSGLSKMNVHADLNENALLGVSDDFETELNGRDFSIIVAIPNIEENIKKKADGNIMRVSDGTNPMFETAKREYMIGAGKILALYSNTRDISTGQFGEYPLIALCSDGRWALGVGDGEVDYSYIRPMSRDVYLKERDDIDPLAQLDDGVVFLTKAGLLLGAGTELRSISDAMEGDVFRFADIPTPTAANFDYIDMVRQAINHPQLTQLDSSVSRETFNDYVRGANIGFVYGDNKEIVVANKDKEYCFVFSLDSGAWTKLDLKIREIINDYPQTLALIGPYIYDLSDEKRTEGKEVFFLTKPIKLDTLNFKEGYRAVLRSLIKPYGNKYSGFYAFGSEDGQLWRFLGGSEFDGNIEGNTFVRSDFMDLGCVIERTDVKYMRFAFAGNMKSGSKLDWIEIEAKAKRL